VSIEALFAVRFGHAGAPNMERNGGVVVVESGRLFGGDSWYAYTGQYQLNGHAMTGQLRAVRHFHQAGTETAWGTQENQFDFQFNVTINDDHSQARGAMTKSGVALGLHLIRIAELP